MFYLWPWNPCLRLLFSPTTHVLMINSLRSSLRGLHVCAVQWFSVPVQFQFDSATISPFFGSQAGKKRESGGDPGGEPPTRGRATHHTTPMHNFVACKMQQKQQQILMRGGVVQRRRCKPWNGGMGMGALGKQSANALLPKHY